MSVGMYGTMGGVLGQVMGPCPVIGGVGQVATGLYASVGGVQRAVWPGLPAPGCALETYTWEEIAQVAAAGLASQYWAVGDSKSVLMDGYTYHAQILGFGHDDLHVTDALYGTGYNGGSNKAAVTLQLVELYPSLMPMNDTATNAGGWQSCKMRVATMPMFKAYMPGDLQAVLRTASKKTALSGYPVKYQYTADELWLISQSELFDSIGYAQGGEGTLYAYYAAGGGTKKVRVTGTEAGWWQRSPVSDNVNEFTRTLSDGRYTNTSASTNNGVAISFCI